MSISIRLLLFGPRHNEYVYTLNQADGMINPPEKQDLCPESKRMKIEESHGDETKPDTYFRSYADIGIHAEMLKDSVRTMTYKYAILKNYRSLYNKVVLDVGCGTGILSMFCVLAGAKKVYGVEASAMAAQARKLIKQNKMDDKIEILHGKVEDVILPEKVDVIVSEWMGYFLLYESMLPSVITARDKWLKQGGVMLPSRTNLYLAPATADQHYLENVAQWREIGDTYKLDLTGLNEYAEQCLCHSAHIQCVSPETIMARPAQLASWDLSQVSVEQATQCQSDFDFQCFGRGNVQSLVGWFTVDFPGDISLTTSPYAEATHWQQTVFYLSKALKVEQDTKISGQITVKPGARNHRFLELELTYRQEAENSHTQSVVMDDFVT